MLEEALAVIETERITHGAFVPVQLERLLAFPERGSFCNAIASETLMCCGSPLRGGRESADLHASLIAT